MSQQGAGRVARHATKLVACVETEAPIRVGQSVRVAVDVACRDGCDIGDVALSVSTPDGTTRTITIRDGHLHLVASTTPGNHTWVLALPERTDGNVVHAGCSQSIEINVVPHEASLAVWALPDAAIAGEPFAVKIGATSTAGRVLSGQPIVVRDAAGVVAGRALLGEEAWPGTAALLWTEVTLHAPAAQGVSSWSAALDTAELPLPHVVRESGFTVPITDVPGHRITVTIVDMATGAPLDDAIVRVGAFRATTDAMGRVTLKVPKGEARIVVWKAGFDAPDTPIDVLADADIHIDANAVSEEDPDARWRA